MPKIVETLDRFLRAGLGLAALSMIFLLDGEGRWFGLIGLFPLYTAVSGTCPACSLTGKGCSLDTRKGSE